MGRFPFQVTATTDMGRNGGSSNMKIGFEAKAENVKLPISGYCHHRHSNERGKFKYGNLVP